MCKILFCDWPTDLDQHDRSTLFELNNINNYDIIFFDPLNFAIANGLRQNDTDLWVAEYTSLSERRFMKLLASVKVIVAQIKDFLNRGGVLVLRSNIPNSHIKVMKKSAVGMQIKYTESVTSLFFWLNDFIDRYSFQYGSDYTIRFLDTHHSLYRVFKEIPVKCLQTQNLIPRDNVFVIADSGTYGHQPVITRVTYPPSPGDLYLIPYFLVPEEADKLVEAFVAIWKEKKYGPFRPDWLTAFDKRLRNVNPYTNQLILNDQEMTKLEQQRQILMEKQDRIQQLADMLYKEGDDLKMAIEKAFKILGFQMPSLPGPLAGSGFDFYLRDETGIEIVCLIGASKTDPVQFDLFGEMVAQLEQSQRADKPKGLLIANAPYELPPNKRPAAFCEDIMHQNIVNGFCLMSTTRLFDLACLVLENWGYSRVGVIKESIRSDLNECTGLYEINSRRYLAAATI